jgi:hypothetical protein
MTFLELVQQLGSETGTELVSKITSVEVPPAAAYGETTEHRSRLVRWAQRAWLDIQQDQTQWDFMVKRTMIHLAKGQLVYDLKFLTDSYNSAAGVDYPYEALVPFVASNDVRYVWVVDSKQGFPVTRNLCYYVPPERFYGYLDRSSDRNKGIPGRYSLTRDGCLEFDSAPPHDELRLEYQYRAMPQKLLVDADVPRGLPEKFHDLIIYRAMVHYAGFDESAAQLQRAAKLYRDLMNKLRLEQLREYSMAGTGT